MIRRSSPSFEEMFPPPPESQKIWRYMDVVKFASMLKEKGLLFSSAKAFNDEFEGSIPRAWIKEQRRETRFLSNQNVSPKLGATKATRAQLKKEREWVFVNCWHMSEDESLAMWDLYAGQNGSICIQSTCGLLKECLPSPMHIGGVIYVDHQKGQFPIGNVLIPFMHKRQPFSHERELRAIWFDQQAALTKKKAPGFVLKNVDLQRLIVQVLLRPQTPDWVRNTVSDIAARYELNVTVKSFSLEFRGTSCENGRISALSVCPEHQASFCGQFVSSCRISSTGLLGSCRSSSRRSAWVLPLPFLLLLLCQEPDFWRFSLKSPALLDGVDILINLHLIETFFLVFAVQFGKSCLVPLLRAVHVVAEVAIEKRTMRLKQNEFFVEVCSLQRRHLGPL